MQVAPLDLKQAEVIKGSLSPLYGGGAIAGLVNLVSKTPAENKQLNFLANATSAKGLDLSSFYSQRFKHIGLTVFGAFKVFGPQTKNTGDQQLADISTPANTTAPAISNPAITDTQTNENNTAVSPAPYETVNNPVRSRSTNHYRQTVTNNSDRIYASNNADYTADRYVAFMTLDGNIVRMSKKMEDMICCVTGAELTGDCKTQLQKWQEKIADAPIVAPGNFMDIFSLVNTLNEGEL